MTFNKTIYRMMAQLLRKSRRLDMSTCSCCTRLKRMGWVGMGRRGSCTQVVECLGFPQQLRNFYFLKSHNPPQTELLFTSHVLPHPNFTLKCIRSKVEILPIFGLKKLNKFLNMYVNILRQKSMCNSVSDSAQPI